MELALNLTVDGDSQRLNVDTELDNPDDLPWVVSLCGADAFKRLASGEWEPEAARAILYVNVCRAVDPDTSPTDPPFAWNDFSVGWPFPDEAMERTLAEVQEANS